MILVCRSRKHYKEKIMTQTRQDKDKRVNLKGQLFYLANRTNEEYLLVCSTIKVVAWRPGYMAGVSGIIVLFPKWHHCFVSEVTDFSWEINALKSRNRCSDLSGDVGVHCWFPVVLVLLKILERAVNKRTRGRPEKDWKRLLSLGLKRIGKAGKLE